MKSLNTVHPQSGIPCVVIMMYNLIVKTYFWIIPKTQQMTLYHTGNTFYNILPVPTYIICRNKNSDW